jgi:hypothetical protein
MYQVRRWHSGPWGSDGWWDGFWFCSPECVKGAMDAVISNRLPREG